MKTTLCTWEDETSNRHIQFSVDYVIDRGAVEIKSVTPHKVSYVCPESNTVQNSVGVHTRTGRQLLANQFRKSEAWEKLAFAIANPNGDTTIPNVSVRMEICAV